ncbi:MAG: fba 1, partial [Deltaproteobacteria bacterium]|nr:fba 1 [Deltaproteobacteria bacterium]
MENKINPPSPPFSKGGLGGFGRLKMEWGMKNRLAQLIKSDGRCLFLPIDHGYFQGPTRKLEKPGETIRPLLRYCDALFVT